MGVRVGRKRWLSGSVLLPIGSISHVGDDAHRVLAHELSIPMDSDFCVWAMETAMQLRGVPEIVNTDQGAQFTDHGRDGG